jgi:benzoyl-CoA reductase/2-hydroxyglutaryl-CoA dehydratase subunit BcrC/BadD/HgdB
MVAFKTLQKYYQQRDLAAREWKQKGGRVVGYFCNNVPEEMILAAGFFPLRISGDPLGGTEAADRYTEPFYQPDVRSMFNMLLTGRYDFLDFLIIPHSRDAVLALYYHLSQVRQIDPALKLPDFHLFDILHTRFWLTGLYIRDRVRELKKKLEEWSGKEISDESLSRAIAIGNENKILLKRVASLRAAEPPRLSGVEALQIIGSSMFMLKEEHNKLLRQFLKGAERLPARDGVRLFVEGSPIDNLQFYELVESGNAIIVGEDNCWGNRYSDNPVDPSLDPLEAIAERYHLKSPCPRMHSLNQRVGYCRRSAVEAKAQGALFFFLEWDNAPAWEYPDQKKALEEEGIPTMCFEMQPYLISDTERRGMRTRIEQFVEAIKVDKKSIRGSQAKHGDR